MAHASDKSLCGLSVKIPTTTTSPSLSSRSTLSCESGHSSPSLIDSPPMSPWSMVSSPPVSPSAQAVLAAMTLADADPPADYESSPLVTEMMAAARKRAGYVPGALSRKEPETPLQLTPEQLDFDQRVEAAISKSSALIAEAKAQLAAPIVAPAELTEEEKQEAQRNALWDLQYKKKNEAIDRAMDRNQKLFEDVMALIDELEEKGIPIPDCDDLLTWESNAGYAGTLSKTAAKWPGSTSIINLLAKLLQLLTKDE